MDCGVVMAQLAVVLVGNAVSVRGAEPTFDPLALDCRFELLNAAVKSFFLFGGDGGVGVTGAAAAAAVVASSNGGKGAFNLREEFLDFAVLVIGTPSEMVERPLDDLVTVCPCSCQVVEVKVKIVGQICALGENAGFSVEWGRVGFGDDVVDQLGGGCHSKFIFSPRRRISRSSFLWRGLKVSFQSLHAWSAFGFPSHSWRSLGKELTRRREDVANTASQLSVIGRPAHWAFFWASYIVMMNWGTRGVDIPVAGDFTDQGENFG